MAEISFLRGATATADVFNAAHSVLVNQGITSPASFGVQGNSITVTKHAGVFGNGATLKESKTRSIDTTTVFSAGADPYNGTILYRLDPSLYYTPILSIEAGHQGVTDDPNVLVVGWITYSGGNVPVSSGMLYPAQRASQFTYSTFLSARDVLAMSAYHVEATNPVSLDLWNAAKLSSYSLVLVVNNVASNRVVATVQDTNNEYWVMLSNTGLQEQVFVLESIMHNDADQATSLHARIQMDIGVVVTTGIQYRGSSESTLTSGTISGPLNPGTFSVSLIETATPKRESFRIRYHIKLPAGKKIGFASIGVGNASFFGNSFVQDM